MTEKSETIKDTKEKKPRTPRKIAAKKTKKEGKPIPIKELPATTESQIIPEMPTTAEHEVEVNEKKLNYYYAIGRRKSSVAQIRLYKKGEGEIKINNKDLKDYFPREEWQNNILAPFKAMGQMNKLNLIATVKGGGVNSQSEAIRLAISRALLQLNPIFKRGLKKYGFLTRDARKKERKKPGLKRARRAPQWQKR